MTVKELIELLLKEDEDSTVDMGVECLLINLDSDDFTKISLYE